ncbi:MAG: hypothetical protein M3405_03980 [Acidobacteriota bacterium]|nr:hypothetical protein [Acidobacteriota bacterium]
MKKVLTEGAGFTKDNLAELEKGKIIVKELKAKSDGEVAFCGAIKLDAPRDVVFAAFRRAVEKQRKEVSEERGIFRNPPTILDLKKLSIDKSEIGNLKDCKVGDCSWSLSSAMIEKFNAIDWTSADANKKAEKLIRQIMVDHTADYLKNGDDALMDYNDDPEPLSLADEQKSLLDGLLWLDDFAPEFKEYVREYPNKKLDGIEELSTWEKVGVGFKSVIINTHTILYKKDNDAEIPQGLSISKQIYANHYFHSSMSLTGIISFPQPDKSFKTYVFFVSHSRAGALTGTMGKFARVAVDGEAENKLTAVLKDTQRYTAYGLSNEQEIESDSESGIIKRIFGNTYFIGIIILVLVIGLVIWFTKRTPKSTQ